MSGIGLLGRRRAIASSPTRVNIVEETILPFLKIHYSANDMTNEKIIANARWEDLTGNGFDLALSGFTADGETNGVMEDTDGEKFIRFAKTPLCYARAAQMPTYKFSELQDYTIIAKRRWVQSGNYDNLFNIYGDVLGNRLCLFENFAYGSNVVTYSTGNNIGSNDITSVFQYPKSVVWQVVDSYNGLVTLKYSFNQSNNFVRNIAVGYSSNSTNKGIFDLYELLFFNRRLTPEEIEMVKDYFSL